MALALLRKLPHRINMVWVLMLIPLAAVIVFSATVVAQLPGFARSFKTYWQVHEQGDLLSRALIRARNAHVIVEESGNPDFFASFEANIREFRDGLKRVRGSEIISTFGEGTEKLDAGAEAYARAMTDARSAFERIGGSNIQANVAMLRSDLQVVLDPAFIESANRILDIHQLFSCESRLVSSREFRDRIETLRLRLDAIALPVDTKIRIQSNLNNLRGAFAGLLLLCQDLDRAQEQADGAYADLNASLNAFLDRLDDSILTSFDTYVAKEIDILTALSAALLVVFLSGFAATLFFSARFGRQLNAIIDSIRRIAQGERNAQVPYLAAKDEFGEIAAHIEFFRKNAIKLDEAVIAAHAANEAKTRFLASVSHELRTPLNAILGFSEVIRDGTFGPLPPVYRSYAQDIYASGETLLEQISQILDLSKAELGRQDVDLAPNDVGGLVQIALRRLERKIRAKGIEVVWRGEQDGLVMFDRGQLLQVVTNILDNAVKYNRTDGKIVIEIEQAEEHVVLTIEDTGIGMDEAQIARAHEPFVQFGGSAESLQGVGLGLTIVSKLLEANGGRIEIVSQKAVGTRVSS